MKDYIIGIASLFFSIYLLGSFISASFNIKEWDIITRILIATISVWYIFVIVEFLKNK